MMRQFASGRTEADFWKKIAMIVREYDQREPECHAYLCNIVQQPRYKFTIEEVNYLNETLNAYFPFSRASDHSFPLPLFENNFERLKFCAGRYNELIAEDFPNEPFIIPEKEWGK